MAIKNTATRAAALTEMENALKSLPGGEAAQIALGFLRGAGYVVKAWSREDLESTLDGWDEDLTAEQRERVLDAAQGSRYFRGLADCTDSDWDHVGFALSDALRDVREKTQA